MAMQYIPHYTHFYIARLGYAGVYLFFLFLLQNIDCGYSLKPPHRGGSNVYPQSVSCAKIKKKYQNFSIESFKFLQLKKNLFITRACFRNTISESQITHLENRRKSTFSYNLISSSLNKTELTWIMTTPYAGVPKRLIEITPVIYSA